MQAETLINIYRKSLLNRIFEERLLKLSREGVFPPLLHPGAGQEVAQIAATEALNEDDPILNSHRGLAWFVARGVSLTAMLADCAGRAGGTNNGKGGVMHIVDTNKGIYGESGTLGGGLVISVGMGMALVRQKSQKVVAHFFGDGAANRGTFHESLNWAAVQNLPCIYICENNGWAVSVPVSESTSVENIADRAHGYGIPGVVVNGSDPEAVYDAVRTAADRARRGEGPSLIEMKVTRLLGHFATDPQDYRPDAKIVSELDPLARLRDQIIEQGFLSEDEIRVLETQYHAQVEEAVKEMQAQPELSAEGALEDLYA